MIVECGWCSAEWEATPQQAGLVRNGKNVFCQGGACLAAYKRSNKGNPKTYTPWGWLGCKHVVDNTLPTQDPPEIYVGY